MAKQEKSLGLSFVLSIATLAIILVSLLVVSGNFSSLVTTILKPKASISNPKVTESFADAFKSGSINQDKWDVRKSSADAKVLQTASDNLRFNLPAASDKSRSGSVVLKQSIDDLGDFRAVAVMYRPVVTGDGSGVTGIKFASAGSENDEAVSMRWVVRKNAATKLDESVAIFTVVGDDGKPVLTKEVALNSNVAAFRLVRVNRKYRGGFQVGRDTTADNNVTWLGEIGGKSMGQDGKIALFTTSNSNKNTYPAVAGRVDSVSIGWQGKAAERKIFSDAFANGEVSKSWKVNAPSGVSVVENAGNKLTVTVPAGATNGKAKRGAVVRTDPVIPKDKDFAWNVKIHKPRVVGDGAGSAGVAFASNTNTDDEAANIQWVVSGKTSKLAFYVKSSGGALLEKSSVNVTASALTVRLSRKGDKYAASYRTGDNDTDWKQIGNEESSSFGADGKVALISSNRGVAGKYPYVIGSFDAVSGSVDK